MANRILKEFLVLVLLSLPTSGQNSQQHLICKNVESVFSDGNDGSTVAHRRGIQGSPGKRGPSGEKGERGPIGDQGPPAIVDYEKIFEKINNNTRQGLQEINSRFEEWQRNITAELQAGLERLNETINTLPWEFLNRQRCKEENGLPFDGKCFFLGYLSSSHDLNYNQAVQKCSSRDSLIAELHSLTHQKAIQDFFRSRIPSPTSLWLGMTYQRSERYLRFRFGKEVAIDQFKWFNAYPAGSYDKIVIQIRNDGRDVWEGIFNKHASNNQQGVICEKSL